MERQKKRTWAEISLKNLEHNVKNMQAQLPEGCTPDNTIFLSFSAILYSPYGDKQRYTKIIQPFLAFVKPRNEKKTSFRA